MIYEKLGDPGRSKHYLEYSLNINPQLKTLIN
jgi:hypothetical protein